MIDLGLAELAPVPNGSVFRAFSHTFFKLCRVDSTAVTPAENSTRKPSRSPNSPLTDYSSEYAGLRLGNIHPTMVEDLTGTEAINMGAISAIDIQPINQSARSKEVIGREAITSSPESIQAEPIPSELGNHAQSNALSDTQSSNTQGEKISLPPPSEASMQDFYHLQQNLLGLTAAFGAVIFLFVWGFYSLQIALDYILGACTGIVYLRMLGKNVSSIGRQKKNSSAGRLAVFAGMMIVALRWEQVEVIPVFLGFLTYKAAIIAFVLWTTLQPHAQSHQAVNTQSANPQNEAL